MAIGQRDQFLLAIDGGAHQHQDALTIFLQADVEVHAIGPEVDILLARERTSRPLAMFLLPGFAQACDGAGREPAGFSRGANQCLQRLGEVIAGNALEIEPGNQFLDRLALAQVRRQNLGAEPLAPGFRPPTITHPRLLDPNRPHARGDRTLRQIAVAHDLAMASVIHQMLAGGDPLAHFEIDGLREQPLSPIVKNLRQHIATAGRWKWEGVGDRLVHGGVLLARVGRLGVVQQPNVHRLFHAVIHKFWLYPVLNRIDKCLYGSINFLHGIPPTCPPSVRYQVCVDMNTHMQRDDFLKLWTSAWTGGLWAAPWSKALDDLTPQEAAWQPTSLKGEHRHSIWQIVNH